MSTAPPLESLRTTQPPPLWLLVLFTSIGPLAINLFQPSLPSVARDFDVSYAAAQRAVTVYILGIALGQLIYGPLSDRFGRRPLAIIGGLIFMVANAAVALAPTLETMLVGRVVQAIGGCSGIVLTRAIVRDCYPEDRAASAIGTITMAMLIVPALAPLLGGVLESIGNWRLGFWLLAAFGLAQWLLATALLPETNLRTLSHISFASVTGGFSRLLLKPEFTLLALAASCSSASYFLFLAGAPFAVINIFGGTAVDYGLFSLIHAVGYFFGNWAASHFATRWGVARTMAVGMAIFAGGSVLLPPLWLVLPHTGLTLYLCTLVSVTGSGMLFPPLMAAALSIDPRIAGSASALMGMLPMAVSALGTEAAGLVLSPELWGFILLYAGSGLLAGVLLAGALRLRRKRLAETG